MNLRYLILSLLIFLPFIAYSQDELQRDSLRNKVGIGGFAIDDAYLITASYNRILKKRNEIAVPVYYIADGNAKEIAIGVAFNWALIKKNRRFNFFISPELILNNYWHPKYSSPDLTFRRYGYFALLGLTPSYKISKRISTSLEMKIGGGYQWVKNQESVSDPGSYYRILAALKVYYHF